MRVLVTGASGFIGRRVVADLARASDIAVVAAGRSRTEHLPAGVTWESVDLLAPGAPVGLIDRVRPTHLIHLAWNAQPGQFWTSSDNLHWAAASASLMAAFIAAGGQRIVGAGTCAEYDWTTGQGRLAEDAALAPKTLYGQAKDATRRLWMAAGAQFDLSVAWGRIFWLYGPGEAAGRLVSDVCRSLGAGSPVETTEGRQRRDFLHVDDVAGAFVAALYSDWNGPFNIGSNEARPVRDIVDALANAYGRHDLVRFGARPAAPGEPPLIEADTSVLRNQIGFTPCRSLEVGLAETATWWRLKDETRHN